MNRAEKRRQEKLARMAAKKLRVVSLRPGEPAAGGVPEGYMEELASKGIQLHVAGRLQDAENIYRQILVIDPDHADANHLLGGLACQAGNPAQAIGLILIALLQARGGGGRRLRRRGRCGGKQSHRGHGRNDGCAQRSI